MHPALKKIIDIQELDMQMIQLMRLKRERQKELEGIKSVEASLHKKVVIKENEILKLKTESRIGESEIEDSNSKFKKLEAQQGSIKKVEEFNALSHEMAQVEKERTVKEQRVSDLMDQLTHEEEALKLLRENHAATIESSKVLEVEILDSIEKINNEGKLLKQQRDEQVQDADPEIFSIYERLLKNKKDRVIVPIENRCCSGCHIMVTAQHENIIRKGERLAFCEHCSRIHFWHDVVETDTTGAAPKQRRRRTKATT